MESYIVWFLVSIVFFILEALTLGVFLLFFGLGALITACAMLYLTISVNQQILFFLVVSVLSLLMLRGSLKSLIFSAKKNNVSDNVEDIIGRQGKVTVAIQPPLNGKIDLNGTQWYASSDENIQLDEMVEVVNREKLVLKVKKLSK